MVWSCLRSLKCQHLLRADIEDGKLLSSARVRLSFALSVHWKWCNNKLRRSVAEGDWGSMCSLRDWVRGDWHRICSLTIQDQFWINNKLEVIIEMGHFCSLKVSYGPELGNWKGIQQPCVDQSLLKFSLVLLFESDNQPKCFCICFNEMFVLIRHWLEGTACLAWIETTCWVQAKACWKIGGTCWALAKACWKIGGVCWAQAKACWKIDGSCWAQAKACWQERVCWAQAKACWQRNVCCVQAKACWQRKVCCAQAKACWQRKVCCVQAKTCWQRKVCCAQAKACWKWKVCCVQAKACWQWNICCAQAKACWQIVFGTVDCSN